MVILFLRERGGHMNHHRRNRRVYIYIYIYIYKYANYAPDKPVDGPDGHEKGR